MSKAKTMSRNNTMAKSKTMSSNNTESKAKTMSSNNSVSKAESMSNSNTMSKTVSNSYSMSKSNTMPNNSRMSNSVCICSNTIIGNISNISIIIIGMVVDMLDTSIGKVDRVGALNNTSTIIGLSLVEGSTRVVVSNSIGVGVGRGLSKVRLGISTNSMVSNNWSMVDKRSMGNSHWVSYSMTNSMSKSKPNSMAKTMTQ